MPNLAEDIIRRIREAVAPPMGIGMSDKCSPERSPAEMLASVKAIMRPVLADEPNMEEILASIRRTLSQAADDPEPLDFDGSAGLNEPKPIRDSTRVLNQDEIDSLLGYDDPEPKKPTWREKFRSWHYSLQSREPFLFRALELVTCVVIIAGVIRHW